ncbi:MAG: hypothetical protein ABSE15_07575 [Candidatus Bathyarchaeia archaeon]
MKGDKMKRTSLAVAIILIAIVSVAVVYVYPVNADSDQPIQFLDSGVTILSPVNMTYNGNNLVLNVTLHSAGNLGSLDPNVSMNYSIDGLYNGTVPLQSNGEIHVETTAIGTVGLPRLTDGSHVLTIYLYGLNQRSAEPWYLSYTNTVYFSTTGNPPSPTPSPIAVPTPTLIQTPASTQAIPEISWSVILPLLLSVFFVAVILRHQKQVKKG